MGDEASLVELYCNKPPEWVDQLDDKSHEEILKVGEELNFPRFTPWAERQRARGEKFLQKQSPEMSALLKSAMPSAPVAGSV
jgi:hypothetical protein